MKTVPSLHLYTEYSIGESNIKIDDLIKFAKKHKLKELVITDHNTLAGIGEFIKKTTKNNIKPIIGVDLDVENYQLILLARNFRGLQEMFRLVNLKSQGDVIFLDQIRKDNIFIIDHPRKGYYAKKNIVLKIANFFVGTSKDYFENAVFMKETNVLYNEDIPVLEILGFIKNNKEKSLIQKQPYFLKDPANDARIQLASAIINSCEVNIPSYQRVLPKFENEEYIDNETFFVNLIQKGLESFFVNNKLDDLQKKTYIARAKKELQVIKKLHFIDYFLIIWDLVKFAKEQKILVGPGRGSAAGSLVSFLLGITQIDPIKYNLVFERFINEERVTFPDIDLDVEDGRRYELIGYLFKKYGRNNVSFISAFQRIGAKTAIRDVGRFMGFKSWEIDAITKLIKRSDSLFDAYDHSDAFRAMVKKDERHFALFQRAVQIEKLIRQTSTHAAGIILSDVPIIKKAPVIQNLEGYSQVEISKEYLSSFGLLKFDLLGLKNLTLIKKILKEIYKNYNRELNLYKISLEDKKTLYLFAQAKTNGIFQFESFGMKKTLQKIGIRNFNDLTVAIALYRPGPMSYIDEYSIQKKDPKLREFISNEYDSIVDDTYGVIVFQEQIMQITQKIANFTFSKADVFRKAIAKKDYKLMHNLKQSFYDGAKNNGYDIQVVEKIYNKIEKFAKYGFNKSHAVSYALIAFWLGFLKVHFPIEFYSTQIKFNFASKEFLEEIINDAKNDIQIIPPNINSAGLDFRSSSGKLYLPLTIIKGINNEVAKIIIAERNKKLFLDFYDFVSRMTKEGLEQSDIEVLIRSQALKDFGNVNTLLQTLPFAIRYANMILIEKHGKKELNYNLVPKPQMIFEKRNLDEEMLLEKKYLGFNISIFKTLGKEYDYKLSDLVLSTSKKVIIYASKIKKIRSKNNDAEYMVADIEDSSKKTKLYIFERVFASEDFVAKPGVYEAEIYLKNVKGRKLYNLVKPWKVVDNG